MLKKSLIVVAALSLLSLLAANVVFAGGAGCNKAAAQQAAHAAGHAAGAADGKPCCSRMAMDRAVVALRSAAAESGSAEAIEAMQAAEVAVKKAQDSTGCVKSKAAAEEAALAALKRAAELAGSAKAKSAVDTALVAYNDEHEAAEQPTDR